MEFGTVESCVGLLRTSLNSMQHGVALPQKVKAILSLEVQGQRSPGKSTFLSVI